MELSVTSEKLEVAVDEELVPAAIAKGPSPELDIEASVVTCFDLDQVEGKIPASFGMFDHRDYYRDSW